MNIQPVFIDKDSQARLTRAFDLSEVLAAYAADLEVTEPTVDSFAFVTDPAGLGLENQISYAGFPGVTLTGGAVGVEYTVRLLASLSNGDVVVVKVYVLVS